MNPCTLSNATRTLAEDQDEYHNLDIQDTLVDGVPHMTSVWEPTEAEIHSLLRGERVQLSIVGRMHPPVSVWVPDTKEPADAGDVFADAPMKLSIKERARLNGLARALFDAHNRGTGIDLGLAPDEAFLLAGVVLSGLEALAHLPNSGVDPDTPM